MTITFKQFLNERKGGFFNPDRSKKLSWDTIHNWRGMGSYIKGSKSDFIDNLIKRVKSGVDKQVHKRMNYDLLKQIMNKSDEETLLGLSNVLSYKKDFEDSSFEWGNWQEMILQTVSREKYRMGMYESADSSEILDMINKELSEMDEDEIEEFGYVLYYEFFDDEETDADDYSDFTLADVQLMIDELGEEMYEEILDLLDELDEDEELDEAVSRRLKTGNRNRKKRKFMSTSKAELRRGKQKRKIQLRRTKQDRKRYYRKNKNKIKQYQQSRADAIKKGTHKVKVRRKS